jgi:glutathione S-transferase
MKIWGRRSSINVQKVLWLADELGLSYEHAPAGGEFSGLNDPAFLALNPHGRIPVLEDDGVAIWESHAILRYLAARYGGERFWSSSPLQRSFADRWMDWAHVSLQRAFIDGIFWGYYRTPEAQRDVTAIRQATERTEILMGRLDTALADQLFLAGEEVSLADIPAGTMLYRYFELDIEWTPLTHVEAWYRRLQERPAYRANVMLPFGELKGRLAY